jgi:hypothetical protein
LNPSKLPTHPDYPNLELLTQSSIDPAICVLLFPIV